MVAAAVVVTVMVVIVIVVAAVAVVVAFFAAEVTIMVVIFLSARYNFINLTAVEPYSAASRAVVNLDTFTVSNNKLGFINGAYHAPNCIGLS